jgi:hypothetical protein
MHVDQIDVRKITRDDFRVFSYSKSSEPVLYKRLCAQAAGSRAHGARGVVHGAAKARPACPSIQAERGFARGCLRRLDRVNGHKTTRKLIGVDGIPLAELGVVRVG